MYMKKRIISLLCCLVLVGALLTTVCFCVGDTQEDEIMPVESVIGVFTVRGITEPKDGAVPMGAEALSTDAECTVTGCAWLDSETLKPVSVFEGGKTYVLKITCEPAEGYTFLADSVARFGSFTAEPEVFGVWSRTYKCPALKPISSVSLRCIAVPAAGAAPAGAESFVLDGAGCSIESAFWLDSAGNIAQTFADGQKYTLSVTLTPDGGHRFADTEVTFNGRPACAGGEATWSLDFLCGAYDGADCTGDGSICPAAQFLDAPKYGVWSHAGIDYCIDLGLMNGIGGGKFSPDGTVTRAQLVTILYRVAGSPGVLFSGAFADVKPGLWYSDAIEWAAANGIVNGTQSGLFAPADPITREQIAAILYRYSNSPAVSGDLNAFPDKGAVRAFAADALIWATKAGYINGLSSGGTVRLSPGTNATRAQIASIIMRCLEDYKKVYRHDDTAPNTAVSQSFDVFFASQKLSLPVECIGNRPYIALEDLAAMPVTQPSEEALNDLRWDRLQYLGNSYITLADAAAIYGLGVEFRESDSTIHLYKLKKPEWKTVEGTTKTAYLRLEDIMADYGINGRFTHDGLIELRTQVDYLNTVTDGYYIAWIPLYVNPGENIRNDISTDFNFYNTDFVFTLDCMVRGKGHLGLHGLTHQSGSSISADGNEFGADNTYTTAEMLDRFRSAEAICHRLGYDYDFFEFSHYNATEAQKKVAEVFFDCIAQARISSDQLERRYTLMHECLWVPTPADYVHSAYDRDGIMSRLDSSYENGSEISLFFHPVVDTNYFSDSISGDTMTVAMNENGFLSSIIQKIGAWGYKFGVLPTE